jgi:hypothetical protein
MPIPRTGLIGFRSDSSMPRGGGFVTDKARRMRHSIEFQWHFLAANLEKNDIGDFTD